MPCNDGGIPDYSSDYSRAKARLDEITNLLCLQCQILESKQILMHNLVWQWWKQHKKQDEQRRKNEKKQKHDERQRKMNEYLKLKKELNL